MKIWVIIGRDYEDSYIHSAHMTEKEANDELASLKEQPKQTYEYEASEIELKETT